MRPAPDTPTARHTLAAFHTLAAPAHSELIIKKSRFIGCVQPMADRASAQAAVAALWRQHPGAAHVCGGRGAAGRAAAVRGGDPGGPAGRPMLQVLQHQALDAGLASVVRYFGGVKLGAGALLRAYTDTIAQALRNAPKVSLQPMQTLHCQLPYALEGWLRREIEAAGAQLLAAQHGARVTLQLRLPQAQAASLMQRVNDNGQGLVEWCPAPR